jgi:MOSC domain-containing protein YiiM
MTLTIDSASTHERTSNSSKASAWKAMRTQANSRSIGLLQGGCLPIGVHLIPAELFAELGGSGHVVGPGHLGENVTTYGIELEHLPLGTKLYLGENAMIELTGLRTPCGQIDRFQKGLRRKMLRSDGSAPKYKCGVFGIVVTGGQVSLGDSVKVQAPRDPYSPLPAL